MSVMDFACGVMTGGMVVIFVMMAASGMFKKDESCRMENDDE